MTGRAARRWIGRAFAGGTLVWLLLILLTPLPSVREAGGPAVTAAAAVAYVAASAVCHQRPDRSFHPGGVQMPVCARCTGLYLGAGVGVLAAGVRRRGRPARGKPGRAAATLRAAPRGAIAGQPAGLDQGAVQTAPRGAIAGGAPLVDAVRRGAAPRGATAGGAGRAPAWLRWVVLAAAAPTAVTFAAEMAGWMPSIEALRAAAGAPLGAAVAWVASLVIRGDLA